MSDSILDAILEDEPVCINCDDEGCEFCEDEEDWEEFGAWADGDNESALASAGFGTDEDYGSFGGEDW